MKFVYFGYDFMLPSVQRLIGEGHTLLGIFTFECDNIFNFNQNTLHLAEDLNIPFSLNRPEPIDIETFIAQGTDVFLSAGYPYKIPEIEEERAYGINYHPSLLPKGRGIMPSPTILMRHPEVAGITIHKLSAKFDDGDILFQHPFQLSRQDDVESLSARIAVSAPSHLSHVFSNLPALWEKAKPQDPKAANTFPMPTDKMRTLNWDATVHTILQTGRAFGRFGTLAHFDNRQWAVYEMNGWEEAHNFDPGTIMAIMSREIVIAASNGYIVLKEFQELQPQP